MLILLSVMAITLDAQTTSPSQPEPKARLICRGETETGSTIVHRTCHTNADWALIDRQNGEGVDQYQREFSKGRGLSAEQRQPGAGRH